MNTNARQWDEIMLDAEMYIDQLLQEFSDEWLGNRAEVAEEEIDLDELGISLDDLDDMELEEVEDGEEIYSQA